MEATLLITGASRGLGLELTRQYSRAGWRVLACCRNPDGARELQTLADRSPALSLHRLNVLDDGQIAELKAELGDSPVDLLFNNAGISGPKKQDFGPIDEPGWLDTLRTNVIAPYKLTVALVDNVAASRLRIVAVMGSQLGSIGDNSSGGRYVYRSSKAAVHMVTKSLAVDLEERGITVVVLHPGWVRTDMGGEQAPLTPEESASGLKRLLDAVGPQDSGRLLAYDGRELPW